MEHPYALYPHLPVGNILRHLLYYLHSHVLLSLSLCKNVCKIFLFLICLYVIFMCNANIILEIWVCNNSFNSSSSFLVFRNLYLYLPFLHSEYPFSQQYQHVYSFSQSYNTSKIASELLHLFYYKKKKM